MATTGWLRPDRTCGAKEGGVPEVEDATVGRRHPVAGPARSRRHTDDGLVQVDGSGRPLEGGVAEGEDAAIGRNHPVAAAVGGRRHAGDRLVEVHRTGRPPEGGVPEVEDATVGRHQPVAAPIWRRPPCRRWACSGGSTPWSPGRQRRRRRRRPRPTPRSQYPKPEGVRAIPTIGWLRRIDPVDPTNDVDGPY